MGKSSGNNLLHPESIPDSYSTQQKPYELMHDRKPDLRYLHVFGALCYPTNNSEDLGKLKPKANIGIFIGYSPAKKPYRIYKRPAPQLMTHGSISSRLVQNPVSSTPYVSPSKKDNYNYGFDAKQKAASRRR
ncbi:retrovirus-related pol polyprotein from transposon TNT 1-94 [Tanacetum coccineum]